MLSAPSVWRIDLADPRSDLALAASWLTSAERDRADRGVPEVRRRRVLLRAGLRRVLGDLMGLRPDDVPLVSDHGRPRLDGVAARGLEFSCSASGRVGLVAAAADARLGVDVEVHGHLDAREAAAEGWLAPTELTGLARLPEPERPRATTRCWTQKEAVLKGQGVGLRRSPVTVVTPVSDTGRVGDWWLVPVPVATGHLASLAVECCVVPGLELFDVTLGVRDGH